MSRANFVQVQLAAAATDIQTTLSVKAPVGGFVLPPAGGGRLVLTDSPGRPLAFEVVSYTSRTGTGPYTLNGVVRGLEGTVGLAWGIDTFVMQSLTVGELDEIIAGREPAIAAGTTAQYRRGDKTWQDFATAVRASVMTGLSTVTATAVSATDTLLAAIGKLQAQITGLDTSKLDATANAVSASKLATARSIALAGDVTGSASFDGSANISITATVADDSHNHTIANVDGLQTALDAKLALTGGTLTGSLGLPNSTTLAGTLNGVQVTNGANGTVEIGNRNTSYTHYTSSTGQHYFYGSVTAQTNLTAATFYGSGAGLTALPAAQLSGVVPDANLSGTYTGVSITGNAATATKLATARTINGVGFDGTANITVTAAANGGTSAACSGNAATATALQTARTINGVSFNGSANITVADATKLPIAGGSMTGNLTMNDNVQVRLGSSADCVMYHNGTHTYIDQNVTGDLYLRNQRTGGSIFLQADSTGGVLQNVLQAGVGADNACILMAGGATKLTTTAAGVSVTGTLTASSDITASGVFTGNGSGLTTLNAANLASGTIPDARLSGTYTGVNITGNAATATKLATARTINGVLFDGTGNIVLPADDGTPAGAVMAFARSTAPAGWLKANGTAVSRTTYAALFAAIGTTFGAGDGSTTFNLPDLRGEFLRGWDDARGIDSGRAFGTLQTDDLKSHTHTASTGADAHTHTWSGTTSNAGDHNHHSGRVHTATEVSAYGDTTIAARASAGGAGGSFTAAANTSTAGAHTHTVSGTTSSDSHTHTVTVNAAGGAETRPRNRALLYCIKF